MPSKASCSPLCLSRFRKTFLFLFLFPSGTSSTPPSETLLLPNRKSSFYDLLKPVSFSWMMKSLFSYPPRRQEKIFTFQFSEAANPSGFQIREFWMRTFSHVLETLKCEAWPVSEGSLRSECYIGRGIGDMSAPQLHWF